MYSPDGGLLALGLQTGRVLLWDGKQAEAKLTIRLDPKRLHSIAFSPDSTQLAIGAGEEIQVRDVALKSPQRTVR